MDGGRTRSTRQSALSLPAERVRATARLLKEKDEEAGVSILQMPGLILYPMWLLAFSGVCSLSHVFVEKHKRSGRDATRGSGENSCNFIQTLVHRHIKILPCTPPDSNDAQLRQDRHAFLSLSMAFELLHVVLRMLICHLIFMFALSLYWYVCGCGCVLCECMRASLSLSFSPVSFLSLRPLFQPPPLALALALSCARGERCVALS